MRVHVTELNAGDRLSDDIFNSYGLNILSRGTLLQANDISKLLQHHVEYVEIDTGHTGFQSDEAAELVPIGFPKPPSCIRKRSADLSGCLSKVWFKGP
ncbi:hypothetical protein AB6A23_07760 [Paenibacillus tarimensis]